MQHGARVGRYDGGEVTLSCQGTHMKLGEERILTTHTGSLPRPANLTQMFVRRQRGEAIDTAELARINDEALRAVIDRQKAAEIDIGNDGEQSHDGFFRYV